jgi:hypothetical protein
VAAFSTGTLGIFAPTLTGINSRLSTEADRRPVMTARIFSADSQSHKMVIEYSVAGGGIGIPYAPGEHAEGTNHGYIDLKRHPTRISDIPELAGYVELFRFVRDANSGDSAFRTAGCDTHVYTSGMKDWKYRSAIHLLFEILHWNTNPKNYSRLFKEFEAWYGRQARVVTEARVEFRLGPTSFWDHSFDGYSLRVFVEGFGRSDVEARAAWAMALVSLTAFLNEFSARHQPQLQHCAKRVS